MWDFIIPLWRSGDSPTWGLAQSKEINKISFNAIDIYPEEPKKGRYNDIKIDKFGSTNLLDILQTKQHYFRELTNWSPKNGLLFTNFENSKILVFLGLIFVRQISLNKSFDILPLWIAYQCLSIEKNSAVEESDNWLLTFEDPPFKDSEIFPLEMRSNSQFVVQTSTWIQLWNDDPSVWRSSNTLGKLSSDSSLLTNPSASKGTKQNMTIWGKRAVYTWGEGLNKWKSKMAFAVKRRTPPHYGLTGRPMKNAK